MTPPITLVVADGGGTKTRLRALDASGATVGEALAGPSSLSYGVGPAWESVGAGVRELVGPGPYADVMLRCGMAGSESAARVAAFRAADPFGLARIEVVNDGFAALVGALGGGPGVALAVGTGTAVQSMDDAGRVRRASGWGFGVGDEGSGAWVGRRAVAALTRHLDGRAPAPGPLVERLLVALGGATGVAPWLLEASATAFARLVPEVAAADAEGDPLARAILAEAVAELEVAVAAVDRGGPVAVLGGLAPLVIPRMSPGLAARRIEPLGDALDGLVRMGSRDG